MATGPRWRERARARAGVLAVALACALPGGPAAAIDLPAVMSLLAQRKSGEARFTEERTVSTLDSPLRSSGTLTFQAPDRFARFTLEPRSESMEVQGNSVVLKRGSRTRQLALDAVPEMGALVDAMRGTLNGDGAALQKHFRIGVSGERTKWVLLMQPLDARLATQVQSIEITGQEADIRSIDLRLAGGDRSLMLVEPLAAAKATAPR